MRMGVINVKISDETEGVFRIQLLIRKGSKKGGMGEAVDEALRIWSKSITGEIYEALEEAKKEWKLNSVPEVVHQIIGDWYNNRIQHRPPGAPPKRDC